MPDEPIRVLLVDDHDPWLRRLTELLATIAHIEVVGTANGGAGAVAQAAELQPDVVAMDIRMPGMDGLKATRLIKKEFPHIKILAMTMVKDSETLAAAMRAGANGYLLKGAHLPEILRAFAAAANGEVIFDAAMADHLTEHFTATRTAVSPFPRLTSRELEVLELVAHGLANPQIARRLNLSTYTVRNMVSRILDRIHAADRAEAISLAREAGLAQQPLPPH